MTDATVISGVYTGLKFLPGLKAARIEIEIPQEQAKQFLDGFGPPDKANPVPVALARLNVSVAQRIELENSTLTVGGSNPSGDTKRSFKDLPRSQQAALRCQEAEFQTWLSERYPSTWERYCDHERENECAKMTLYAVLGIASRKQLDEDERAGAQWSALNTDFDMRGYGR